VINALIIDDEQYCIDSLVMKLEPHSAVLTVVGTTTRAAEAAALVAQHKPHLIFLDINLGSINGFELLEQLGQPLPGVIFCTAYDHFAIKAFRYNALDYLLKPVQEEELAAAVAKAAETVVQPHLQQIQQAISTLQRKSMGLQKLALPSAAGFELVELTQLVRLEAASNYTRFYLTDGRKITVSKTLKEYEEVLDDEGFARIHQSHIINLKHLTQFNRGKTATVTMQDGMQLDISASRRDQFMGVFRNYFKA
jgi:two-component system LytT family response regulator